MPPQAVSSARHFRHLAHYPAATPRTIYLAIVVLTTIALYYELYIQSPLKNNNILPDQ